MRPYELFIGLRYTRAKRRNHFISVISLISILGITVGVAALIIVLSVMNGFQKEIRTRMLGVTPHLQVYSDSGQIRDWESVLSQVAEFPGISEAAPFISGQGMLSLNDSVQGVMVRGILPAAEDQMVDLSSKIKRGSLDSLESGQFNIVIGSDHTTGPTLADWPAAAPETIPRHRYFRNRHGTI